MIKYLIILLLFVQCTLNVTPVQIIPIYANVSGDVVVKDTILNYGGAVYIDQHQMSYSSDVGIQHVMGSFIHYPYIISNVVLDSIKESITLSFYSYDGYGNKTLQKTFPVIICQGDNPKIDIPLY